MLPQSHIIIATHLHKSIKNRFNIELDKRSLIYGSIKPDIPLTLTGLKHFKPQSFNYICNEIHRLSLLKLMNNKKCISLLSKQIGITTHYVADYFCIPHNDREKYKNHFLDHLQYEKNLHELYKFLPENIEATKTDFNIENKTSHSIKALLDKLHYIYTLKGESLTNDMESSIEAANIVASYIIYHNTINNYHIHAA